jgi:hypothetical protein
MRRHEAFAPAWRDHLAPAWWDHAATFHAGGGSSVRFVPVCDHRRREKTAHPRGKAAQGRKIAGLSSGQSGKAASRGPGRPFRACHAMPRCTTAVIMAPGPPTTVNGGGAAPATPSHEAFATAPRGHAPTLHADEGLSAGFVPVCGHRRREKPAHLRGKGGRAGQRSGVGWPLCSAISAPVELFALRGRWGAG